MPRHLPPNKWLTLPHKASPSCSLAPRAPKSKYASSLRPLLSVSIVYFVTTSMNVNSASRNLLPRLACSCCQRFSFVRVCTQASFSSACLPRRHTRVWLMYCSKYLNVFPFAIASTPRKFLAAVRLCLERLCCARFFRMVPAPQPLHDASSCCDH